MKFTMLLAAIAMLFGFGAYKNGSSESSSDVITVMEDAPPPNVTASWRFCGGIPGCKHCCLTLKSTLGGSHDWAMYKVINDQVQTSVEATKTTSTNSWWYGLVGDPDCFVIKFRQSGGQWQTSSQFCPSSSCCYP